MSEHQQFFALLEAMQTTRLRAVQLAVNGQLKESFRSEFKSRIEEADSRRSDTNHTLCVIIDGPGEPCPTCHGSGTVAKNAP